MCDESSKKGKRFSYFYGGAMLKENKYDKIASILNDYKAKFGLNELKRTKINDRNYKSYMDVLELFFTFVKSGDIKVRIMFSPNEQLQTDIPHSQNETYTKFYHTFIINSFNIFYAQKDYSLRLIFDDLPETKEQCLKFKTSLIKSIKRNKKPKTNKVFLKKQDIAEVDSKKHVILQCVDVIVGLTDFFLNTTDEDLNNSVRAKAKFNVWKFIYERILEINKEFNFTKSTLPIYSHKGWNTPYQHFVYHQKK